MRRGAGKEVKDNQLLKQIKAWIITEFSELLKGVV